MADQGRRRVVIVGGGFAGLFAARSLRRAPVAITLIDRAEHHLFQPLLYQCATGILSEGKIAAPLREMLKRHHNAECVLAEVTGIDPAARTVQARRPLGEVDRVRLRRPDPGGRGAAVLLRARRVRRARARDEDDRGRADHPAPGVRRVRDGGERDRAATESTHWLTFVLVGAGPTGVELAGQIREVATKTLRAEYRHIAPQDARVLLLDGGKAPLASFGPELSGKAAAALRKLGVELHMESIVTKVDLYGVEVRGQGRQRRPGTTPGTVLWTAGVEAPPLAAAVAAATGASRDRAGRILVGPDLTIPGPPGDHRGRRHDEPGRAARGGRGGHAVRAVRGPADQALRWRASPLAKPFRYHDLGSAAYISRGSAVMSVGKLRLSGFIGWWGWLFIHIGFMTGFRNRFGALLSWWFAFTRDLRRERTLTSARGGPGGRRVRGGQRPGPDPQRSRRSRPGGRPRTPARRAGTGARSRRRGGPRTP